MLYLMNSCIAFLVIEFGAYELLQIPAEALCEKMELYVVVVVLSFVLGFCLGLWHEDRPVSLKQLKR